MHSSELPQMPDEAWLVAIAAHMAGMEQSLNRLAVALAPLDGETSDLTRQVAARFRCAELLLYQLLTRQRLRNLLLVGDRAIPPRTLREYHDLLVEPEEHLH